jgi:hypothetical protein
MVSDAIEEEMDGTSGALYSIFMNALTQYFHGCILDPSAVDTPF